MHDQGPKAEDQTSRERMVFRCHPGRKKLFSLFYQAASRILHQEKDKPF